MNYEIYRADLERDKESILDFWRKNHSGTLDDKYRWIYEGNPAGRAMVWMLKHVESGRLVGVTALFPRRFVMKAQTFVAGIAGDFLVNHEHRTVGPAIMLQRSVVAAAQTEDVDFIYGFPNKNAEVIMKRVGYRLLGPNTRLVKIIRTAPQIQKLGFVKHLVNPLSPILDAILRILSIETWYPASRSYVCTKLHEFDERFDRLFSQEKRVFTAVGERGEKFLRWKFLEAPTDMHNIFAIFDSKESNLKGYIVYRQTDRFVEIRDFFFSNDKKAIMVLMTSFLRHARSLSPESVVINLLENKRICNAMRKFGFLRGTSNDNIFLYCSERFWEELSSSGALDNCFLMKSDDDTY